MKLRANLATIVERLVAIHKVLGNLFGTVTTAAERHERHENQSRKVEAEIRFPKEIEQKRDAEQKTQTTIQKWMAGGTCVAAAGAIIYAAIAAAQWSEMRKQTMEANRAWLAPSTAHFHDAPVVGKPVTVIFPYEDVGRQPAIDMKMSIFFDVVELPKTGHINDFPRVGEDFCRTNPPTIRSGVVYPGTGPEANWTYSDTTEQKINWDSSLEAEKNILRVRGCISYLTFGRTHYSWFCRVFTLRQIETVNGVTTTSSRRVGADCPDGNGAD